MSEEPDAKERYDMYRRYIQHEDGLVHNRITWMLSIHGFLYGTYGFTLQKLLEIDEKISQILLSLFARPTPGVEEQLSCYLNMHSLGSSIVETFIFLITLCIVGGAISIVSFVSIKEAYKAATAVARTFDHQYRPISRFVPFCEHKNRTDGQWLNQYSLFESNQFRLPLLTGGGYKNGERRGFRIAAVIPIILVVGWAISLGFVVFDAVKILPLFLGRPPCPLLMTPYPTISPSSISERSAGIDVRPFVVAPKP